MSYIISEDGKELLKDVRDFCINEVKEQVKEYDISGEWPKEIYDKAIEMQLHMMDVPEAYGGLGLDHIDQAAIVEQIAWADAVEIADVDKQQRIKAKRTAVEQIQ